MSYVPPTSVTDTTGKTRRSKRILITGAAGFIGSHTADFLLNRGDTVVILDNLNTYYDPEVKRENVRLLEEKYGLNRVRFVQGDFTDPEVLRKIFESKETKPDGVIHLGARAGVRPSITQPFLYIKVNIEGTVRIFEQCVKSGVNHVVYASSSSVYGGSKKDTFSETDRDDVKPVSQYAATKKACELMAHTYHHLYDLNVTGLRFFTVYGPRGRPDMAAFKFIDRIANGRSIDRYGDGSSERDWTFVADIVNGVVRSLDRPMGYQVFNLGNGNPIKLNDFITIAHEEVERALGHEVPLKIVQKPDQPGDVPRTSANVSLARKLLDYEPSVSLRQGLRKTVEWYVKRHVSIKNKKKVVRQSDSTNSLSSMVLECKGTEVDRMFEFRKKSFSEDMTPLFTNNDVIALPVRTSTSTSRRHLCSGLTTWTRTGEAIPLDRDVPCQDEDDEDDEETRDVEEEDEIEEEVTKEEEKRVEITKSPIMWKRSDLISARRRNVSPIVSDLTSEFVPTNLVLPSTNGKFGETVTWTRSKRRHRPVQTRLDGRGLALSPTFIQPISSLRPERKRKVSLDVVKWNSHGQAITKDEKFVLKVSSPMRSADETKASSLETWNRFGSKMTTSNVNTSLTIGTRIYRTESYAKRVIESGEKHPEDLKRLELFLSNAASLSDHVVVAVKSSGYGGDVLLRQVQSLCRKVSSHSFHCNVECVDVPVWGKVIPALNSILSVAQRQGSAHLLLASAEVELSPDALHVLRNSLVNDSTLVVGACFEGYHDFAAGEVTSLNAMTSPWNTAALWNVERLSLTGFLNVSEKKDASGMEEVSVIALHQRIWPKRSGAKLVRLQPSQMKWKSVNSKEDGAERVAYHQQKMKSKFDRAQMQMRILLSDSKVDFENAKVQHISVDTAIHVK